MALIDYTNKLWGFTPNLPSSLYLCNTVFVVPHRDKIFANCQFIFFTNNNPD